MRNYFRDYQGNFSCCVRQWTIQGKDSALQDAEFWESSIEKRGSPLGFEKLIGFKCQKKRGMMVQVNKENEQSGKGLGCAWNWESSQRQDHRLCKGVIVAGVLRQT